MEVIKYEELFSPSLIGDIQTLIDKINEVKSSLEAMVSEVKTKAQGLGDALASTSSATKGGRDNTKEQAAEVEKLYAAYQQLGLTYDYVSKNLQALLATQERQNKASKLANTVNSAQSDSISRLKAMLDLAKIAYEGMTESQRQTTESGQQLATCIKTLDAQIVAYNKSIKTQSATSKAQGKENTSLITSYSTLSDIIAQTCVDVDGLIVSQKDLEQAQKNGIIANQSAEGSYNQLAAQYNLCKIALNNMSQEMRENAEVGKKWEERAFEIMEKMKEMQEATGKNTLSVGDYEKAMNGLNIATKQVLREMPTLANSASQFFIAISNNIPIFVDNLRRAAKEAGSVKKALMSLISVQFMLEGVLLVALTLLSKYGSQWLSQIKIFKNVNKEMAKSLELHNKLFARYGDYVGVLKQEQQMEEKVMERRIELLRAQNAPLNQIQKAENDLLELRKKNNAALQSEYKDNLLGTDAIKDYNRNVAALIQSEKKLRTLQEMATANVKRSGELRKSDKELIEKQEKLVEYYKARVDAAEELMNAERDLALATSETAARQYAERYQQYQKELQLARETEDMMVSLVEDRFKKERDIAIRETERQIEDIRNILNKAPEWLSAKQRAEYEKQIKILGDVLKMNLVASFHEEEEAIIELRNQNTNIELGLMKEGKDKEIDAIKEGTKERKAELMRRYLYEKELTEEERKEIIRQWRLLGKEGAQAEKEVILNYAQRDLSTALDYKLAVIESKYKSEYLLNRESIKEQIQYWKDYLENIKKYGNLSAGELENVTTQVQTEILKLQTAAKKNRVGSLWDFINLDKEQINALKDAVETAIDYMDEWIDKRIEMAEIAVEQAEKEADAAKTALDYEMEARANGYANNVELARKEYAEKLALQQQALAEQKRLEKIQESINTAQQISSLVTATANLWSSFSSLGVVGPILAAAATALMFGSFIAAKVQAAQVANQTTYGEGMTEYLNYGGSHASGNDIDFGRDKNGRRRRVERGEVIGVVNKKNVNKYGANNVMNIIQTLNNGTFEKNYTANTDVIPATQLVKFVFGNDDFLDKRIEMSEIANEVADKEHYATRLAVKDQLTRAFLGGMGANYGGAFGGSADLSEIERGIRSMGAADLSEIERGIKTLISQNTERVVQTKDGRIEYKGNTKRVIKES